MGLRLSDLVFRHQSPRYYDVLRPVTYAGLLTQGRDADYVEVRRGVEGRYRRLLGLPERDDRSFMYATVVGFHLMESPQTYPGFTYYFGLTRSQVDRCVFHVVDPNFATEPMVGRDALRDALTTWFARSRFMSTHQDPVLGREDPRIEVVVQDPVTYDRFVTQGEDRLTDPFGGIRMNTGGRWF